MKTILLSIFLTLSITGYSQKKEQLFNGKNLKGWTIYVEDKNIDPQDLYYVKDGDIETVGVPNGYIRTYKKYSNYHLNLIISL